VPVSTSRPLLPFSFLLFCLFILIFFVSVSHTFLSFNYHFASSPKYDMITMKEEILTKFLLSQTSLRDALPFADFTKLQELNRLLKATTLSDADRIELQRLVYKELLHRDRTKRARVEAAITRHAASVDRRRRKSSLLQDPSKTQTINAIFIQTLVESLDARRAMLVAENERLIARVTDTADALADVAARTVPKLDQTGDALELPPETRASAASAETETAQLAHILRSV
jgi:hypothetical protein